MKVLVIEDDEAVQKFVGKILISAGFDVIAAGDGKEGLTAMNNIADIDIVVTDLLMPEKEGMEIIRTVKKSWPRIKILAISGGGKIFAEEYLRIAGALGADGTLKKPFTRHELLESVELLSSHPGTGMAIPVIDDDAAISETAAEASRIWNRPF